MTVESAEESTEPRVLHAEVPGRVRLAVPAVWRDPEAAHRLEKQAANWSGVRRASASPLTGNLLVEFEPQTMSMEQLTARVQSLVGPPVPRKARANQATETVRRGPGPGRWRSSRPSVHLPEHPVQDLIETLESTPVAPPPRPRTRRLEAAVGASAVAGAGALLLAVRAHGHNLAFDRVPLELAEAIHNPALTALMRGASDLISPAVVTPVTVAAMFMGVGRQAPDDFPWLAPTAVLGGGALIAVLKLLLRRTRPIAFEHLTPVTGFSLPSGHAFMALCLYGLLAHHGLRWLRARRPDDRRAAWFLFVSAAVAVLMVGVSRVYLGVHYPTDVIAGYVLALLWLFFLASLRGRTPLDNSALPT